MAPAPAAYDTGMKVAAAPAAPKSVPKGLEGVRERAHLAEMKSDLRNLATYEEQFAADNGGYYFSGKASASSPLHGFTPSSSVTIHVIAKRGTPPDWSATATHLQSSAICVVQDGVINCEQGEAR
jgi:Tfp pilus assembly protein PilE